MQQTKGARAEAIEQRGPRLQPPRSGAARKGALAAALLLFAAPPPAQAGQQPSLVAVARQEQTASSSGFFPVKLRDTSWWIDVQADSAHSPLAAIEYTTRFLDERPQLRTGRFSLADGPRSAAGKVRVICPARTDYERSLQVRLRAHADNGSTSDWVDVRFPPATTDRVVSPGDRGTAPEERRPFPAVTVEVGGEATVDEVRAALRQQARQLGAAEVRDLRIVRSSDDRIVFAADPVGVVPPTPSAPTAGTPVKAEAVLGQISIPLQRK